MGGCLVSITDDNCFFIEGVQEILTEVQYEVFPETTLPTVFIKRGSLPNSKIVTYISTMGQKFCFEDSLTLALAEGSYDKVILHIYQDETIEKIKDELKEILLNSREKKIFLLIYSVIRLRQSHFSPLENIIMQYINKGYSQNVISRITNLSSKAVSAHKRNAMRKIKIKNDIELHRWLLKGNYDLNSASCGRATMGEPQGRGE